MSNTSGKDLSASIKFVYKVQRAELRDDIPEEDRKILEGYKDRDMLTQVDRVAHDLMQSHRDHSMARGRMAGLGYDGYLELLGKIAVLLVRRGEGQ